MCWNLLFSLFIDSWFIHNKNWDIDLIVVNQIDLIYFFLHLCYFFSILIEIQYYFYWSLAIFFLSRYIIKKLLRNIFYSCDYFLKYRPNRIQLKYHYVSNKFFLNMHLLIREWFLSFLKKQLKENIISLKLVS